MLLTLSKLSAPNCLFALRSKRKGRSSRKKRKAKQRVNSQNKILTELAQVGSLLPNSAKLANIWKSTSKLQISLRSYLRDARESRRARKDGQSVRIAVSSFSFGTSSIGTHLISILSSSCAHGFTQCPGFSNAKTVV